MFNTRLHNNRIQVLPDFERLVPTKQKEDESKDVNEYEERCEYDMKCYIKIYYTFFFIFKTLKHGICRHIPRFVCWYEVLNNKT